MPGISPSTRWTKSIRCTAAASPGVPRRRVRARRAQHRRKVSRQHPGAGRRPLRCDAAESRRARPASRGRADLRRAGSGTANGGRDVWPPGYAASACRRRRWRASPHARRSAGWPRPASPLESSASSSVDGDRRMPRRRLGRRHDRQASGASRSAPPKSRSRSIPSSAATSRVGPPWQQRQAPAKQRAANRSAPIAWPSRADNSGTRARRISRLRASESTSARPGCRRPTTRSSLPAQCGRAFEGVRVGGVVKHAGVPDDVGLGGMQVAARRIHPQAQREPRIDFQADSPNEQRRHSPIDAASGRCGSRRLIEPAVRERPPPCRARQLQPWRAVVAAERIGLGLPVEMARPTGQNAGNGAWWPRDTATRASARNRHVERRVLGGYLTRSYRRRLFRRQRLQPLVDLAEGLGELPPAALRAW